MRVLALTCSNTEIVCALGCAGCLVGVDSDSDYPPAQLAGLPRVGRDLEIDVQAVAALRPDLVLASLTVPGHERVVAALREAGLPTMAPEPTCLAEVYRDILDIADALGVRSRGERLVASMQAAIPEPAPPASDAPSVLIQWWPKPVIAPGRASWADDLLRAAGARNPIGERWVKSAPLSDAEIAELDPDAMVMAWCGVRPEKYRAEVIYRKPQWQGLKAIRHRQVVAIGEAYLGRPGPRLTEGYRALARLVRDLAR